MKPKKILKLLLIGLILGFAITLLIQHPDFAQSILDYTPSDPFLAALVILILYAIKSASIVLPYVALVLVTGHLYSPGTALLINFLGLVILMTIPYILGNFLGLHTVERFTKKYPKFKELLEKQNDNSFFICYFIRVIGCLPGDLVTMYFGATGTPFWKNLLGGLLGLLPGMVTMTLIGNSMKQGDPRLFLISSAMTLSLSILSLIVYSFYKRHKH